MNIPDAEEKYPMGVNSGNKGKFKRKERRCYKTKQSKRERKGQENQRTQTGNSVSK